MVNTLRLVIVVICIFLLFAALPSNNIAYSEEQSMNLMYKSAALPAISKERHNYIESMSMLDIDHDGMLEISITTADGQIQIFKWQNSIFKKIWESERFKYTHRVTGTQIQFAGYKVSEIIPVSYKLNNKIDQTLLFIGHTGPKSADIYELTWQNDKYEVIKRSSTPFNWYRNYGTCADGSTAIIGETTDRHEQNVLVAYKWNGIGLHEIWRGVAGAGLRLISVPATKAHVGPKVIYLIIDKNGAMLSCDSAKLRMTPIDIAAISKKLLTGGLAVFGATKAKSKGELWFVEYPINEYSYHAKLFVSQFNGKRFSPFSRVYFKGLDSDMVQFMTIADVDGDGIGEIVGIEENIRKKLPRKHPGDEMGPIILTSIIFLAKWNGTEYEVKWRRKGLDDKASMIAVDDVTGDGLKEVLVTDKMGNFYVFEMPAM